MNSGPTLSQRLPSPRELGGWKFAINPVVLLFWLYLRRVFGCLDTMLADFAAGRLEPAEPAAPRQPRRTRGPRARRPSAPSRQTLHLPCAPARRRRTTQPRLSPTPDNPGRSQPRPNQPPPHQRRLE